MTLAHFPGRDPFRMAAWQAPRAMRGWLTDDRSLTARIRSRCERFSLRVVSQGKGRVMPDELAALGVHGHGELWIREVLLMADGRPVVFARSLVVDTRIPAAWHLLHGLGARPLAAVLFDDPRVRRSPLEAARLDGRDTRWHHAARATGMPDLPPLWARRSAFWRCGSPLLVTEAFLPAIGALAP
ncbi:chorismate lyase [Zoogloea sp.]|uniref:chorismate--pyruvate lyase family protein n=1 Tax=Zoogloea sp. TaxID=49181 RepID=UPI002614E677|nr:chorismate lyase [Zoogloea sp.]MDD3352223.1 chorismate lyase [Zoogloea sp.]